MKKSVLIKTIVFSIFICSFTLLQAQNNHIQLKSTQDVIKWYTGWKGNPDSLNVYIDSTFTAAEKDSIKTAVKRWNAAGCKPAFRMTDSAKDAQVTFTEKNITSEGLCSYEPTDAAKKNEKAKITIDSDRKLTLTEIATHELGHAIGLDDTKGAGTTGDAMKAAGTNGSGGNLSKHDSTELKMAMKMAEANIDKPYKTVKESGKKMAFLPGETGPVTFRLDEIMPHVLAGSAITVKVVADNLVRLNSFELVGNELFAMVNVNIDHWDGMYMLEINIINPNPALSERIFGIHYISRNPVPETPFNCPFEIQQQGTQVQIIWEGRTTYPYPGDLRANLVIQNVGVFYAKNGGNFSIPNLAAGQYVFTLHVDDYKGNAASFTQVMNVTGVNPIQISPFLLKVYPNPFSSGCQIISDPECKLSVFDIQGRKLISIDGGNQIWQPTDQLPSGIYVVQAEKHGQLQTVKIQYNKQ